MLIDKRQNILGHLPGHHVDLVGKSNYLIGGYGYENKKHRKHKMETTVDNFIGIIYSLSITKDDNRVLTPNFDII